MSPRRWLVKKASSRVSLPPPVLSGSRYSTTGCGVHGTDHEAASSRLPWPVWKIFPMPSTR